MQELVDTHCHIQSIGLNEGERTTSEMWAKAPNLTANGVVSAAKDHGVSRLICVGCDLDDSRLAVDFAKKNDNCWASIGIHPHEAKSYADQTDKLADFANMADYSKVVAIGECGLDFYYGHSPKADQIRVLGFQMELAKTHNLPLIFHVREAFIDFWPIYESFSSLRGVLHSFTDNLVNLERALKLGLYIGVNGIATFAKNPQQLEVYRQIPLKNLLLETDAPYLTPEPYRGTINEPKRVGRIADFLADLRGENRDKIAETTTANARQLFGI
jgi:TatD DNase family protein